MIFTQDIVELRQVRWTNPSATWGLVPTMGALHAGHLSLVEAARRENDFVAASIYVNPTQFAAGEDLSTYPRTLENDLALLKAAGVSLVFAPTNQIMYPPGFQTRLEVTEVTGKLEGSTRPEHFGGVTLIVAKLFNIFQPTRAYFGQKDAQQTVVIGQMVKDLNFNLEMVVCPTVRDVDGLALSSRNRYLSKVERADAPLLFQALQSAESALKTRKSISEVKQLIHQHIGKSGHAKIDYVSIAKLDTLNEMADDTILTNQALLISLAVYFGSTRLIDNIVIESVAGTSRSQN